MGNTSPTATLNTYVEYRPDAIDQPPTLVNPCSVVPVLYPQEPCEAFAQLGGLR